MSRLGKRPIFIPKGVEIKVTADNEVNVKGPKGSLIQSLVEGISLKIEDDHVVVETDPKKLQNGAFHGLFRSLISNMIVGVSTGFQKKLTLIGVGYRAAVQGNTLDLQVGYSHPTRLEIPSDIQVNVDKATSIVISGFDKQKVGQFAATVRSMRPPEPYKGKGIRYENEYVRKKAGKAAKGA